MCMGNLIKLSKSFDATPHDWTNVNEQNLKEEKTTGRNEAVVRIMETVTEWQSMQRTEQNKIRKGNI